MGTQFVHQEHSRATQGGGVREGTRRSRSASIATGAFFATSLAVSIVLVAFTIVFFYSAVTGPSMMATLNAHHETAGNTDSVLVNRFGTINNGDMIVTRFYTPVGENWDSRRGEYYRLYIKRVIGIPGDSIYFERIPNQQTRLGVRSLYNIWVNGVLLDESEYLHPHYGQNLFLGHIHDFLHGRVPVGEHRRFQYFEPFIRYVHYPNGITHTDGSFHFRRREIVLPQGFIFYLGDNRGRSHDSSDFGPQRIEYVMGVVSEIIGDNTSLPGWVWGRFWDIVLFRWVWGN